MKYNPIIVKQVTKYTLPYNKMIEYKKLYGIFILREIISEQIKKNSWI